jgi:hypothetical protein
MIVALLQPSLQAVCVEFPFKELRAHRDVALIFHGTVRDVQQTAAGEVVIFDVLRVWKGKVPRRITIYDPGSPRELAEFLPFVRGTEYFVSAYRLRRDGRVAFGLPTSGAALYETGFCAAHAADAAHARAEAANDPGHEPSR